VNQNNHTHRIKIKHQKFRLDRFGVLIALGMIFAVWQGMVYLFHIPSNVLPPLTSVIYELVVRFTGELWPQMWETLRVALVGLGIGAPCGILVASLISQFPTAEKVTYPYIIAMVTLPMVALLPIVLTWTGFGITARIIVVIFQVIPIVTLNSITGFRKIETAKIQLGQAVGATKFQIFVKTIFPNALPYVFTGLRLGTIFSLTTTISAELVASNAGLGNRVTYYARMMLTESSFACIILIAAIGVSVFMALTAIEKKIVVWKK